MSLCCNEALHVTHLSQLHNYISMLCGEVLGASKDKQNLNGRPKNCICKQELHVTSGVTHLLKKTVTENITCVNAKQVKVKPRVLDGKPRGGGIICPSKMYQLAKCSTAHSNHMKTEGGTRELLIISNYIFPDVA